MSVLRINLQEGFTNDTVVVWANGQEVFNKTGVKTRLQIGLAGAFEVDVPESSVDIQIALPLKNVSESFELQVSEPVHLGVSITHEGRITHRVSQEPFGYL